MSGGLTPYELGFLYGLATESASCPGLVKTAGFQRIIKELAPKLRKAFGEAAEHVYNKLDTPVTRNRTGNLAKIPMAVKIPAIGFSTGVLLDSLPRIFSKDHKAGDK